MIKVIHVLSDMKIGGAGIWLLNYLGAANKDRFDIKVVLPQGSLLIDKVRRLGFEVVAVDGMKDKSFDAGAISLMTGIFRKERPQIVHTHASLSARLAAKIAGAKIIYTKHCIEGRKACIGRFAYSLLNNLLSDGIIAVSSAAKQGMIENGVSGDKISLIYGGIGQVKELDTEERSRIRNKWGIAEGDVVVGIVARLAKVKGHNYFINAAEIISRDNNNVKFLIAGAGPMEKELKELARRLGLADRIIFTGFVENTYEIFNIMDINVISSLSEALCLSLIEGMNLGKPSVASNTGGIPEVVKDGFNGYLVPVGDHSMLAERILELIHDPELRKTMGDRGRELVVRHFAADAMARGIEKLYENVIKDNERV